MKCKIVAVLLAMALIVGGVLQVGATAPAAGSQGTGVSQAAMQHAKQFYGDYDLRVYDWEKPAVSFGVYIIVGDYQCQAFYAADGYIIGIIYGDWPQIPWQQQLDTFNAYRGLPSVKGFFPDFKTMEQSGIIFHRDPSVDPSSPATIQRYQYEMLELVNAERAKAGLPQVVWDDDLAVGASIRAEEISRKFSHERPGAAPARKSGKQWPANTNGIGEYNAPSVADELGIPYRWIMENISSGKTAEGVVGSWMRSSGHRANILKTSHTRGAVGFYVGEYGSYWVLWLDS